VKARRLNRAWPILLAIAWPVATGAQVRPDSAMAAPQQRYDAGPLHRLLLGSHNRDLWAMAVKAEVLDLDRYSGGLTLTGLGGGQQTRSLRFRSTTGREYAFRLIDKDASRTLDPELQRSIAAAVLQDQVSALLPMAPLVVSVLLEATGVLQAPPSLVVMPDAPALGEYRAEFANRLGFIEERPTSGADDEPGFAGAADVEGSNEFLSRLERSPENRVDDRAFLRARLMDAFVGDWDRHPDQWRWAAFEDGAIRRWQPVPRDRDWALARLDGLLIWAAGFAFPNYVGFDYDYPSAFRLSWAGRALDRRLLVETPRSVWEEEAAALTARLTDDVIDRAVRRLPPSYYERVGPDLARALKNRRDRLAGFAREFYLLLAEFTDIHATDAPEIARIERLQGDSVRVTLAVRTGEPPHFARTFAAGETREIRVWLHGGADMAEVVGQPSGSIRVRVLGGGSSDTLVDRTSGSRVHFFDDRGTNVYSPARGTEVDESVWIERTTPGSDTQQAPARDWGSWWIPYPIFTLQPDVGLVIGAGLLRYGYGFRYFPWQNRLSLSAGLGTGSGRPQASIDYQFFMRGVRNRLHASYSGLARENFFGFGNETTNTLSRSFYRAEREDIRIFTSLQVRTGVLDVEAGPTYRAVRPIEEGITLLDSVSVYGNDNFQEAGFAASFEVDTRNSWPAASRGIQLRVDSRFYPSLLDVAEPFGGVRGEGSVRFGGATPASLVLALRTGGEKLWGRVPFHEAAYIGGNGTLRGYANNRFAGNASAFANAEVRFPLTRFYFMLPGHLGLFGLADTGRVFVRGEESDRWHSAWGGGLWLSALSPVNAMSIAIAKSRERTGIYVQAGFMF
jgi:hypothetical protein